MNCMELVLSSTTPLKAVQDAINETWGISQILQKIFFNGKELKDSLVSLETYGLKSGDCLELKMDLTEYRPITLRTTSGQLKNLVVGKEQTIYHLIVMA